MITDGETPARTCKGNCACGAYCHRLNGSTAGRLTVFEGAGFARNKRHV